MITLGKRPGTHGQFRECSVFYTPHTITLSHTITRRDHGLMTVLLELSGETQGTYSIHEYANYS